MKKIIMLLAPAAFVPALLISLLLAPAMAEDNAQFVKVLKPADKLITQKDQITVSKSDGEEYNVKLAVGKNSVVIDAQDDNGEPAKVLRRVLRLPLFKDIDSSHWAKNEIELTCVAGLFEKTKTVYFRPDEAVSRDKFAKMICDAVGLKPTSPKSSPARDVPLKDTNSKYINYVLNKRKLMETDNEGNFFPQDKITRAEAIVAIAKLEHLTENWDMGTQPFDDMPPRQKGARWIAAAKAAGLLKFAETRGYLDADGYLTNAEYAAIISKTAEGKRAIANAVNFDSGYSVEKGAKK